MAWIFGIPGSVCYARIGATSLGVSYPAKKTFFSIFLSIYLQGSYFPPDHMMSMQGPPSLPPKGSCTPFSRIDSPDSGINGESPCPEIAQGSSVHVIG